MGRSQEDRKQSGSVPSESSHRTRHQPTELNQTAKSPVWLGFVYAVKGAWRLDHSIQSKIIAMAFSMAAEIERDLISQRTKEALRFKKSQGLILGRPPGPGKSKLDPYRPEIEGLLANGSTQKFVAGRYHTTEVNLHNWLKKRGLK